MAIDGQTQRRLAARAHERRGGREKRIARAGV